MHNKIAVTITRKIYMALKHFNNGIVCEIVIRDSTLTCTKGHGSIVHKFLEYRRRLQITFYAYIHIKYKKLNI